MAGILFVSAAASVLAAVLPSEDDDGSEPAIVQTKNRTPAAHSKAFQRLLKTEVIFTGMNMRPVWHLRFKNCFLPRALLRDGGSGREHGC